MRKLPVDRDSLFAIVIAVAAATLIVAILWPAFKRIANALANLYFERTTAQKVSRLRGGAPQQVRVRQTDLINRMTAQDRALFRQAEALLAENRIVEGARILEAIKFQRRAIDELEKAGLIDEACGVLVRMNVPGRAAVIYERNAMFDKAAHYFVMAGQHESAGNVYIKMARDDAAFWGKAGEAFAQGGKIPNAIQAFATIVQTDRVIALATAHKAHELLAAYIADAVTAWEAFRKMTPEAIAGFFQELSLTARHVRLMAQWTRLEAGRPYLALVLARSATRLDLAQHFWASLPRTEREALLRGLPQLGLTPEALAQHSLAAAGAAPQATAARQSA